MGIVRVDEEYKMEKLTYILMTPDGNILAHGEIVKPHAGPETFDLELYALKKAYNAIVIEETE